MAICPKCGASNADEDAFCSNCGTSMKNTSAPEAQQQPDYQQTGYQQAGYQQNDYQQAGYQQNDYQQNGYQQPYGYQQPGYQQPPMYQQTPVYQEPPTQIATGGMLAWSIVTLLLCTIPGIIALVNIIGVNNCPTAEAQQKKLSTAKICCIIGTVLGGIGLVLSLIGSIA